MQFFPLILTLRVNLKREVCPVTYFFLKIDFPFLFLLSWRVSKIWDKHFHVFTHQLENWCCVSLTFVHVFPWGGKMTRQGGKISDLRKKGDFLKCYLHNFKSYRYSITLELFETQCLKKNNPKNVSFSITDFVFGFYISYSIRFYLDVLNWGMWDFKATFCNLQ